MKKVANLDVELTVEERNLLSVGYKNVIGARRASWRILSSIEQKEEARGNEINVKRIKEYRQKVESELTEICNDIMTVVDEHIIPSAAAGESTVFYHKMWGYNFYEPKLIILALRGGHFQVIEILMAAGKEIITDILQNSRLEMKRKRLLITQ